MTCRWMGVYLPVLRKLPSSDHQNLRSPSFLMNFGGKLPITLAHIILGPEIHPYGWHISILSTCYVLPGLIPDRAPPFECHDKRLRT